jgi:hypothetical protein
MSSGMVRALCSLCLGIALAVPADAHDHGQFGQYSDARDKWLRQQRSPSGASCCSENDADLVEEDIRNGKYWIRWREFDWTLVPDDALLPYPNPTGQPVVWWWPQWQKDGTLKPIIRCYSPGALL